jgi:hypothetical protein
MEQAVCQAAAAVFSPNKFAAGQEAVILQGFAPWRGNRQP